MTGFDYSNMTPENTQDAASIMAEAVRYLNLATTGPAPAALKEPQDADTVLAEVGIAVDRLRQLFRQITGWLVTECEAGRLRATGAGAAVAVSAARQYLTEASSGAETLREALHAARQITAVLAAAPSEENN